jgi:hypothetical protein
MKLVFERNRKGYILIDVLAASVILAVGICAAMTVVVQWHQADQTVSVIQASGYLAQDGFEGIRAHCAGNWTRRCLEEKSGSERLRRKELEFERTIIFRDRPDLDRDGHLVEALMKITWTTAGRFQEKEFVTYYLVNVPVVNLR